MQKNKNTGEYSWSNSRGFNEPAPSGGNALLVGVASIYIVLLLGAIVVMGAIVTRVLGSSRTQGGVINMPTDSVELEIKDYSASSYGYTAAEITELLKPCTVTINIGSGGSFSDIAFGEVVTAEGYILTGSSKLLSAEEVRVTDSAGKTYSAEIVGNDPATGITVLKTAGGSFTPAKFLRPSVYSGDRAVIYGCIAGVNFSAAESAFTSEAQVNYYRLGQSIYEGTFIATASPADTSGGGIVADKVGNIVGVNTYAFSAKYAISAEYAHNVAMSIIENGAVTNRFRPGILCERITDSLAGELNIESGLVITFIEPGSAFDTHSVSIGDVLLSIDGAEFSDPGSLWLAAASIGSRRVTAKLYSVSRGSYYTITYYNGN